MEDVETPYNSKNHSQLASCNSNKGTGKLSSTKSGGQWYKDKAINMS